MPILPPEPDCIPTDLLQQDWVDDATWWLMYTKSRQEKMLMRRLREKNVPHYGPQIPVRQRSPSGRIRTSYQPLFNSYVFVCGDNISRYDAICTGCIRSAHQIDLVSEFLADIRQVQSLIGMKVPLSVEERIEPGQKVRVKNGVFAGYEGQVLKRTQETRLLVVVRFMEQGISVKLDDCQLEPISQLSGTAPC